MQEENLEASDELETAGCGGCLLVFAIPILILILIGMFLVFMGSDDPSAERCIIYSCDAPQSSRRADGLCSAHGSQKDRDEAKRIRSIEKEQLRHTR